MPGGIFLLLGSNVGDRYQHLADAVGHLGAFAPVLRSSSIYKTMAWGYSHQPDFLNQVLEVDSSLSAEQLLRSILDVEITMGRKRVEKWGPRVIDIDILFYNNEIIKTPDLTIPHPEIQNRKFTLAPLAELSPSLVHPVLRKTIQQLLDECKDSLEIMRLPHPHSG